MIKKLFVLLVALCLCASLVSCGKGKTPDREEIAAMFEGKGSTTYLVQVSINPEFELVLDDRGEVCDLIYRNKDAEVAFAEVVVVGKFYDEAMPVLLEAAKRGGYLTDGSTITMTVVVRENGQMGDAIIADLEKAVQEYVSAEQYTLQVLDGRAPEEPSQNGDDGNQGDSGAQNNVEEVRDANGKLVSRTEQHQTLEGLLTISEYFDANEKISKRVEELNGAVIAVSEYDANGKRISCVREAQTPEGVLTVTEYFDANENRIKEEQALNGTVIAVSEYDTNGRKISYVQNAINPEGVPETRSSTFSYDENGNVEAEYTHVSDGSYIEAHYYANGSMAHQYIQTADGGYLDDSYDESGNLTSRKRKVIHDWGAYSLWTDYPDGTREEYFYETDGGVWYNWFDANGNQLGQKRVQ